MEISVTSPERGGRTIVTVSGEVDVYTSSGLRKHLATLIDADNTDLVVDLTGVVFIDSTGLGVLVGALKKLRRVGGQLRLIINQAKVIKVFQITALTEVFTINDTLEAALIG